MRRSALLLLLPAVVATPSAAGAQARQQSTVLMSEDEGERAFQERAGYADAVIASNWVVMSVW